MDGSPMYHLYYVNLDCPNRQQSNTLSKKEAFFKTGIAWQGKPLSEKLIF